MGRSANLGRPEAQAAEQALPVESLVVALFVDSLVKALLVESLMEARSGETMT
jgi:hypothetical protein